MSDAAGDSEAVAPPAAAGYPDAGSHPDEAARTDPGYRPGTVKHIVLFRYKAETTEAERQEIALRFRRLAEEGRRNGRRYIVSIEAGVQNSPEGLAHGLEHGFIVTFNSEGDRNYYVGHPFIQDSSRYDPAHHRFKDYVGPYLHDGPLAVVVFDFSVG